MARHTPVARRRGIATAIAAIVLTGAASLSLGTLPASATAVPSCTTVTASTPPVAADAGRTYLTVVSDSATVTIPTGVTEITFDVCGAQGSGAGGGLGGRSVGTVTVPVSPATHLTVVGGSRDGRVGGGGSAGLPFAGGGYSGVFTGTGANATPLAIAGGGGGSGSTGGAGGTGGGSSGGNGTDGSNGLSFAGGGKGGSQLAGGLFGTGSQAGSPGASLQGGDGGIDLASGGGGGGGYNGGGGGAASRAADSTTAAGGGGGGAGFLDSSAVSTDSASGVRAGAGAVVISYPTPTTLPATPTPSPSGSASPSASSSPSPTASASASSSGSAVPTTSPTCPSLQVRVNTPTVNATGLASVTVTGASPGGDVVLQGYSQNHQGSANFDNDPTPVDRRATADSNGLATFDDLRPPSNTRLRARQGSCPYGGQSAVVNVRAQETLAVTRTGTRSYVFSGKSIPARPGGLIVSLYRIVGRSCGADVEPRSCPGEVFLSQARADAISGQYSIRYRFGPQDQNVRDEFVVKTGQDAQNAPGRSNVRSLLIF